MYLYICTTWSLFSSVYLDVNNAVSFIVRKHDVWFFSVKQW